MTHWYAAPDRDPWNDNREISRNAAACLGMPNRIRMLILEFHLRAPHLWPSAVPIP
jgi:hypothetical protein